MSEELAQIREDVAYIRGRIDQLPDYGKLDERISSLEKWKWGFPASFLAALVALVLPGSAGGPS